MKKLQKLEVVNAQNLQKMLIGSIIESVEPLKNEEGVSIITRSFVKSDKYYRACIKIKQNGILEVEYTE